MHVPKKSVNHAISVDGEEFETQHMVSNIFTLAAPVLLGMMLNEAALPPLQSLLDGPSTVFWVADLQNSKRNMT